MPQTRHDQMIEAIKANTDSTDRLNKTMLATIEALQRYTAIQVGEPEPEIECTPEFAEILLGKIQNLFAAESTEGVLPAAIPVLIREPRSASLVEIAVAEMLESKHLVFRESEGLIYKNRMPSD